MLCRWVLLIGGVLLVGVTPLAGDDDPFGEREDLAQVAASAPPVVARGSAFVIQVRLTIPPGWHLYGPEAAGVDNPAPTVVAVRRATGVVCAAPRYPAHDKGPYRDPGLDRMVTTYERSIEVVIPATVSSDASLGPLSIELDVAWGCCSATSCRELRRLERDPLRLVVQTRVTLAQPSLRLAAPELDRGSPCSLVVALSVPSGMQLAALRIVPKAVSGIRWQLEPEQQTTTGASLVQATWRGEVLAAAEPGQRRLVVVLSWETHAGEQVLERVEAIELAVVATIK
jgi:hypothetical protein